MKKIFVVGQRVRKIENDSFVWGNVSECIENFGRDMYVVKWDDNTTTTEEYYKLSILND